MKKEVFVLVQGYRVAQEFPRILKRHGMACVHIQLDEAIAKVKPQPIDGQLYEANIVHSGDLPATLAQLERYRVIAVLAGTESGVETAEILAHALGLAGNSPTDGRIRRDKHLMMQEMARAGLPTVAERRVASVDEARDAAMCLDVWPLVVKPLDSAGTDGVFICHSPADVMKAAAFNLGRINIMGVENRHVLIQEFLEGTEYVVNTVTLEGVHYVSDIWRCHKQKVGLSHVAYDWEELLPYEGSVQDELRAYLFQALDALRFKHGPAHSELMMTAQGPRLIETGARVGGGINATMHTAALGHNQLQLTVDAILKPAAFKPYMSEPYQLQAYAAWVIGLSSKEGEVARLGYPERIRQLESLIAFEAHVQVGDSLKKTIDLLSSPASFFLAHPSKEVLAHDYQAIKEALAADDAFTLTEIHMKGN